MAKNDFSLGVLLYPRYPIPAFLGPALREMGVDYVAAHFTGYADMSLEASLERIRLFRAFCEEEQLRFRILIAYSEFPDEVFVEAAQSRLFEGVQLQEAPWGKIIRGDKRKNVRIQPFAELAPTMTRGRALEAIEAGAAREVARYERLGCRVASNNVFPVLFHPLAKANMTVCAKFMKESFTPLAHSVAWGSAIQYDTDLWANGDLWFRRERPGHSADELRASLLYAYWTGVSRFLVEGAGGPALDSEAPRFETANGPWVDLDGLVDLSGSDWSLSERGNVLKEFMRDYVHASPRRHTFREVEPDVAVVRFPDAECGMSSEGLDWENRTFGYQTSPPISPQSKHLLSVWNLLTHNSTGRHMTFFTRQGASQFFFPLTGVVVFDHRVGYKHISAIPLLVLTGAEISPATQQAVERCVAEGATCVSSLNLVPSAILDSMRSDETPVQVSQGKGRWLLTRDFSENGLPELLRDFLGQPDEIRYRFRHGPTVRFRMEDRDPNRIGVHVQY